MTGRPAAAAPGALRHPIVERDVARIAARPRHMLYVRCGVALVAGWLALRAVGERGAMIDRAGAMALHGILTVAAVVAGAVALAEAADAVPAERRQGTFPLLRVTPLGPAGVAAAFLASRVLTGLLPTLAVVPVSALAFALGGVSLASVALGVVAIPAAAVQGASLGLLAGYAATTGRDAARRAGLAVMLLVALGGAVRVASFIAGALDRPRLRDALSGAGLAWSRALAPADLDGSAAPLAEALHLVGAAALLAATGIAVTARRVARESEPVAGGTAAGATEARAVAPAVAARRFAGGAAARAGAAGHGDAPGLRLRGGAGRHPLVWAEARSRPGWRSPRRIGAVLVGLALVLPTAILTAVGAKDAKALAAWNTAVLAFPFAAAAIGSLGVATYLAEEREAGRLALAAAAPFRGVDHLRARPLGLLHRHRGLLAACLLASLALGAVDLAHPRVVWGVALGLLVGGPAWVAGAARIAWPAATVRAARFRLGMAVVALGPGTSCLAPLAMAVTAMALQPAGVEPPAVMAILACLHPAVAVVLPAMAVAAPATLAAAPGSAGGGVFPVSVAGVSVVAYAVLGWRALLRPSAWTDRLVARAADEVS